MINALANEPPVSLGPLRLLPLTREIVHVDGRRDIVEPRVMQVLIMLVRANGAVVSRDALIETCWDGRIVGEDAINRAIGRLRHVARGIGSGIFRVETVTHSGYRLIAQYPDTTKTDDDLTRPDRVIGPEVIPPALTGMARRVPKRAIAVALGLLIVVACLLAWSELGQRSGVSARPMAQLEILPFVPLVPDASPELVRATRGELLAAFAKTALVDIVETPSHDPVGTLFWRLSGTIGRSGPDLHFVVHLTHVTTGKVVWSAGIDRPANSGTGALKGVAAAIEEVVATSLSAAASYPGGDLPDTTLALFAQWCEDVVMPTENRYGHSQEELRRALAQTPDFGRGWSWLAGAVGAAATASDDPIDVANARASAPAIIARALYYTPGDPIALMARAKILPPGDFLGRDAAFRLATNGTTSDSGDEHSAYSVFLLNVGRIDEAVHQANIAYALDPLNPTFLVRYAKALGLAGQTARADRIIGETLALWPDNPGAHRLYLLSAVAGDRYGDALATIADDHGPTPAVRDALVAAVRALRTPSVPATQSAADRLARLSADPNTNSPLIASMLGNLGSDHAALAAVDRLIAAKGVLAADILFSAPMEGARRTPEFGILVRRIGLVAYWRKAQHLPDTCKRSNAPPFCVR